MKLNLTKYGNNHPMTFVLDEYLDNGNLYVGLVTHESGYPEPWQNLTINLSAKCKQNCAFIDVNNNGNEIVAWLIRNKLGKLTGNVKSSGFCIYPEFEFNTKELSKYIE